MLNRMLYLSILIFSTSLYCSSEKTIPGADITVKDYEEVLKARSSPGKGYALSNILRQQKDNASLKVMAGKAIPTEGSVAIDLTRAPSSQIELAPGKSVPTN